MEKRWRDNVWLVSGSMWRAGAERGRKLCLQHPMQEGFSKPFLQTDKVGIWLSANRGVWHMWDALLVGMALWVCLQHSPQVYSSASGRRSRTLIIIAKDNIQAAFINIHNCISNTATSLLSPCPTPQHEHIFLCLQQLELCSCILLAINSMAKKSRTFSWGNIQLLNDK